MIEGCSLHGSVCIIIQGEFSDCTVHSVECTNTTKRTSVYLDWKGFRSVHLDMLTMSYPLAVGHTHL